MATLRRSPTRLSPVPAAACCALCDLAGARLYPATLIRPTGAVRTSLLCRLCFVRQTGVEPHRAGRRPLVER
jgi:hypothetical protein